METSDPHEDMRSRIAESLAKFQGAVAIQMGKRPLGIRILEGFGIDNDAVRAANQIAFDATLNELDNPPQPPAVIE